MELNTELDLLLNLSKQIESNDDELNDYDKQSNYVDDLNEEISIINSNNRGF